MPSHQWAKGYLATLEAMRDHGGHLVRYRNGCWSYLNCPIHSQSGEPIWFTRVNIVQRMAEKGWIERLGLSEDIKLDTFRITSRGRKIIKHLKSGIIHKARERVRGT